MPKIVLWEQPTSLLAALNSTCFGRKAALLGASAKNQRSARSGPSLGLGQTNAALEAALLGASAIHLRSANCGPFQGPHQTAV